MMMVVREQDEKTYLVQQYPELQVNRADRLQPIVCGNNLQW